MCVRQLSNLSSKASELHLLHKVKGNVLLLTLVLLLYLRLKAAAQVGERQWLRENAAQTGEKQSGLLHADRQMHAYAK